MLWIVPPNTERFQLAVSGPAAPTAPEPSSLALLGIGAAGLLGYARRRGKAAARWAGAVAIRSSRG